MLAECLICENNQFVVDSGYVTCIGCGSVQRKELCTDATGFCNVPTHAVKVNYTRINRFKTKIIGALQRRLNHKVDTQVLGFLKSEFDKPTTPERFIEMLTQMRLGRRKPYMYIAYYYELIFGVQLPMIPPAEEQLINRLFREIFYATNRLKLARPTFPMTTLLRLIVFTFEFSKETTYIVRFSKGLRCAKRRKRYRDDFEKCLRYIVKNHDRTDIHRIVKWRETPVSEGAIYEAGRPPIQTGFDLQIQGGDGQGGENEEIRPEQDDGAEKWAAILSLL